MCEAVNCAEGGRLEVFAWVRNERGASSVFTGTEEVWSSILALVAGSVFWGLWTPRIARSWESVAAFLARSVSRASVSFRVERRESRNVEIEKGVGAPGGMGRGMFYASPKISQSAIRSSFNSIANNLVGTA